MNTQNDNSQKPLEQLSNICKSCDWQWILERVKLVMLNPSGAWATIKGDAHSIKDIYTKYVVFLAAVPAVAGFIGNTISAPRLFFSWLVLAVVTYLVALVRVYLAAMVLEFLAPKFEGQITRTDGVKLFAYSYTPAYVGGILSLIPSVTIAMLQLLFLLYGLYCLWLGIPALSTVPDNKRFVYYIVSVIGILIVGLVLGVIVAALGVGAMGAGAMRMGF